MALWADLNCLVGHITGRHRTLRSSLLDEDEVDALDSARLDEPHPYYSPRSHHIDTNATALRSPFIDRMTMSL